MLVIDVLQPGEDADRILAAVAAALGRETLPPPDSMGTITLMVDVAHVWKLVHDALWTDPANDGELVVRLKTPAPPKLMPNRS